MKNEKRISLTKGGLITFLTSSVIFILAMASSIILARALGPEGRGIATLTLMIPPLLVMFGTFGTEVSNVYFAGNKKFKLDDIVSNSIALTILISIFLFSIFYIVYRTPFFQNYMSSNMISPLFLWIAIASLPFNLLFIFLKNILLGKEHIGKMNLLGFYQAFIQLLLVLLFVVVLKLNVLGAVLCFLIGSFICSIISLYYVSKISDIRLKLNFKLANSSLRYGGKAYIGNLAQFLNYRLDIFLVAYFLNPAAVGFYGIAVGLAEKLWMVPGSIGTVLFPRVSSINTKEANKLTPIVARHTFFSVLVLAIILFIFSKHLIVLLFGKTYLPSVKPLLILLPGVVALSISKILTSDLAGRGKPQFGMVASCISLPINICLNIILIPKWGISGAAFASTIAYWAATTVVFIAFLKISKNSLLDILILKKEDINKYVLPKFKMLRTLLVGAHNTNEGLHNGRK